jgi:hypothetical protein
MTYRPGMARTYITNWKLAFARKVDAVPTGICTMNTLEIESIILGSVYCGRKLPKSHLQVQFVFGK